MPFKPVPKTQAERDAQLERIDAIMAAKKQVLDFTNVKDRQFNVKHLPAGDYPAKVTKVDSGKSKAGNAMWCFTIAITGGSAPGAKGASYPYYCVLDANNLWKIRNLFAAAGINIPKKRVALDPGLIIGKAIGVTLEDDEYEDKLKSVVAGTIPVSDIDEADAEDEDDEEVEASDDAEDEDDEEEDEEPEPPKKTAKTGKAKKAKPAPADDDEDLEELEIEEL